MPRKRTLVLTIALGAAAGGAVALGGLQATTEEAPPATTAASALGAQLTAVAQMEKLPIAAPSSDVDLRTTPAVNGRAGRAAQAFQLAAFKTAGVVIMRDPAGAGRVCLATTGERHLATCLDANDLLSGRTVLSVPLKPENPESLTTTPRVDFFVVPDEVASISTVDGKGVAVRNVVAIERPTGGPVGTVTYTLTGGRQHALAFASANP
jgi:hypothetical protein